MGTSFDHSDFVADIDAIFGSAIDKGNKDQILLNFLNSRNDNSIKQVFADHYKQLHDSYKSSKRFVRDVVIRTSLTNDERKQLTDAFPGLRIQFTNEDKNPHAYAKASRVLEFHNIMFQRLHYSDDDNIGNLLKANGWDVYVKDCGGDPTALLREDSKYLHVCSPNLGHDSYDSVRYTHRITSLINRTSGKTAHLKAKQLLETIQSGKCTTSVCSNTSQKCAIRAPFVMFVHSIYDMTLTDIADAMDSAGALMGYASVIFSDEILIRTTGSIKPLNVWWKYSDSLSHLQWNPELVLNHVDGTITFGFDGDDGFNYSHSLANYKSFFTTSRFFSSAGIAYSLELQENRDGIQFIRFTRELKPSNKGVTHTLNLRSLENKYLVSMYDIAPDYSTVSVSPTAYRNTITPWLTNPSKRLIPYRFLAERDPVDKTINYLSSVKSNLKPNECLNYLRNYCTRSVHNGSVLDQRLSLDETQIKLLSTALYLNVYDSNYRSGKIVQQAVNDLDVARSFSYSTFRRVLKSDDYLNINEGPVFRAIRQFVLNVNTSQSTSMVLFRNVLWYSRYAFACFAFGYVTYKTYKICSRYPVHSSRESIGLFAHAYYSGCDFLRGKIMNFTRPVRMADAKTRVIDFLLHVLPKPSGWWSEKNFSRVLCDQRNRIAGDWMFRRMIRPVCDHMLYIIPSYPRLVWRHSPLFLSSSLALLGGVYSSSFACRFVSAVTSPILMENFSHIINTRDLIQTPVTKYTYVEKTLYHSGSSYSVFVPDEFSDDERTVFAKSMIKSIYKVDLDSDEFIPTVTNKLASRSNRSGVEFNRDRLSELTAVPNFNEIKAELFPRSEVGAQGKLSDILSEPDVTLDEASEILEIGVAPGSWLIALLDRPITSYVGLCPTGRPHLPLSEEARLAVADRKDFQLVDSTIQAYTTDKKFSHILSDAAGPSDYVNQSFAHDDLVDAIITFSLEHLGPNGCLVVKLFDLTPRVQEILTTIRPMFASIRLFKPPSSKPLNPESYLIATGYGDANSCYSVESDYLTIISNQEKNLSALVDEVQRRDSDVEYEEIPVAADGNCCFSAATLNRVSNIIALKANLKPIFAAKYPNIADLLEELRPGVWGGSAFLHAFGEHCGVKYIVHDGQEQHSFGSPTTRVIHLKRESEHYSILGKKHEGTADDFRVNSFPPFNLNAVTRSLARYINFSSANSNYRYSGNMDVFCTKHRECRNNAMHHTLILRPNHEGLIFFVERDNGQLCVNSINHALKTFDLHLRLHVLYLADHYVLSTHKGYSPVSEDDFKNLDKHFETCACGKLGFFCDSHRTVGNLVYYCKKATLDIGDGSEECDLLVEIVDRCKTDAALTLQSRHLIVPVTVSETQRVVDHPTHTEIVELLRQNYDNTINNIVIKTPVVDPAFLLSAVGNVYGRAKTHMVNLTGGLVRLAQTPLIETGIPSIIVNTMAERREVWRHTIDFTCKTLKRYHTDMVNAHKYARPMTCRDTGFHLYSVSDGKILMGSGVNIEDVRWGWDGVELINFDSLTISDVKKATNQSYISFNKHSVLLQSYHHYQRTKGYSVSDIRLNCLIHPIQGIPGGGKTEYVLRNCQKSVGSTLVLTVSKAAKIDMQGRASRMGLDTGVTICTFDSFMINYDKHHKSAGYATIWFDEARLTHAGDWLWAAFLTECKNLYIVGDVAQIPYCERTDFIVKYSSPNIFSQPSHNLSLSYRCPQDILHWMRIARCDAGKPFYDFPISTQSKIVHSVNCHTIGNIEGVPLIDGAQYLVYTQDELREMIEGGFSNCRTIHQYQGNQNSHVILVRLNPKDAIPTYKSMSHMLVAFTRHTNRFEYYTCCPVEKDITYKNVQTIKSFSDTDLKLRAGGRVLSDSDVEITMPHTQQPYLYPKVVRDLNDKYGFGAVVPMRVKRLLPEVIEMAYPILEFDPLAGYLQIIREYNDLLYHVPSGIENTSDHDIFTISDKQFFGEYSLTPSASTTKDRTYARPLISTSSRLRSPMDQHQVVKAFCERNGAVPQIKGNVDGLSMAEMLLNTVLEICDDAMLELYERDPILPNNNSISTWIARQPTGVRNQILSDPETIDDKDLTRYNFTIKGNAKPDLDRNPHMRYKSAQTIAYQDKSINAIFCPIMADFTDRLVAALHPSVVLFNRLSTSDYVSLVNSVCPYERFQILNRFYEIDFSKFDKSQDQTALEFECALMRKFGVPDEFVSRWFSMHVRTTLYDVRNKFTANVEYQRKSGDAGTWVLNTVFQMAVVVNAMRLETEINAGRCFSTFSGDDSLIFVDRLLPINVDHVSYTCANVFNLEVKLLRFSTPYFCSKYFLPTSNGVLFVPDVVKTLVKLGRRDLISREHALEYFISFSDNNQCLLDAYNWPTISFCIADRYSIPGDHSILIQAIATIASDQDRFLSLWDFNGTVDRVDRPSLDL